MIKEAAAKAVLKALKDHFTRGLSSTFDPATVRKFRSQGFRSGGPESLVLSIPSAAASIVGGKKGAVAAKKATWSALQKAPLDVDTALGNVAHDITKKYKPTKNLFLQKETLPMGKDKLKVVHRPSITAPLSKARDIATPMVMGYTLEKGLRKLRENREQQK
jgi:hypothetical protein